MVAKVRGPGTAVAVTPCSTLYNSLPNHRTNIAGKRLSIDNSLNHFYKNICDRCGLVVKSRLSGRKVPESKPDSTHIRHRRYLLHAKSYIVVAKRPPVGVVRKLGEGVPAQVSPSSFDSSSKLRGPYQNTCRAASERSDRITELN
ncbi:hypothetical protein AVEN_136075-1 [Araneus ventricosus]|uniref:Uncharacterized protein n=1 Tax=Araneus ventricosus TaxID=182803 RepID=A0A4Y2NV39_ARAVE|nr:hypothetical protein AVEN_249006-1 [Araneus ventricosus]GBO29768.1 hypothetical protein AVEN_136075-1 [Araneus ventricosus]